MSTKPSLLLLSLAGCVTSENLSAVRPLITPVYAPYDQPRVDLTDNGAAIPNGAVADEPDGPKDLDSRVKDSFRATLKVLNDCHMKPEPVAAPSNVTSLKAAPAQTIQTSTSTDGKVTVTIVTPANEAAPAPGGAKCVKEIAAYAVDQCISMANTQNDAAGTTSIIVGMATVGAALATDGIAISNPGGGNTAIDAALASAVTSNAASIPKLFPQPVSVKPSDIITAATVYADALGVDDGSFNCDLTNKLCTNALGNIGRRLMFNLARIHDAALSACPAIAYHRISRPRVHHPAG